VRWFDSSRLQKGPVFFVLPFFCHALGIE